MLSAHRASLFLVHEKKKYINFKKKFLGEVFVYFMYFMRLTVGT